MMSDVDTEQKRKKNKKSGEKPRLGKGVIIFISLCGTFLACVLAAVIVLLCNPTIINGFITDAMLVKLVKDKEIECNIEADISYGKFNTETNVTFWRTAVDDEITATVVEFGELNLYYADSCLYLENGRGFELEGNKDADYSTAISALPDLIKNYKVKSAKTSEGREYSVTITGEGAIDYVEQLYPDFADMIKSVEDIELTLDSVDWNITRIELEGSAKLENGNKAKLEAVIDIVPQNERGDHELPDEVLASMDDSVEKVTVTGDMINLAYAVGRFYSKEQNAAKLVLATDITFFNIEYDKIDWYRCKVDDEWINYVTVLGQSYYYNGNGSCNSKGEALTEAQQGNVDIAKIIDSVYDIFLDRKFSAEDNGTETEYKVELEKEDISMLVAEYLPKFGEYSKYIKSATAVITVEGGQITNISVEIEGSIKILVVDKNFYAKLTIDTIEDTSSIDYDIPDAVAETLLGK